VTAIMIDPTSLDGSELYLDAGLPGFPGVHRFRLMPWGAATGPFSLLMCLDIEDLAFVVAPPAVFFPDYTPAIDRATADRLGLVSPDDAAVYVIVTLGPTPVDATANLLGPLIVNRRNLLAAQVVLEGSGWDVRTRLLSQEAQAS
jgi:flagellar assembly factor FliW